MDPSAGSLMDTPPRRSPPVNLPNVITIIRLVSVPVIVWLITIDRIAPAFWLFICAGLSDAADGFIARRFDLRTEIGAYLDPLADKALLVSLFLALGAHGFLPSWLVILVVSRDILIVGAILLSWVVELRIMIRPRPFSKINTAMQISCVGLVLAAANLKPDPTVQHLIMAMIWIVAITTVLSGSDYMVRWLRSATQWEKEHDSPPPTITPPQ